MIREIRNQYIWIATLTLLMEETALNDWEKKEDLGIGTNNPNQQTNENNKTISQATNFIHYFFLWRLNFIINRSREPAQGVLALYKLQEAKPSQETEKQDRGKA
jgi:hypothetical protein